MGDKLGDGTKVTLARFGRRKCYFNLGNQGKYSSGYEP